ncbi:MAG: hypothetical protein HYX69_04330 [Planctomycetia bacterium]|nr:hypothetical protein [Planctomycetia bacterium]
MRKRHVAISALLGLLVPVMAQAAAPNTLIVNETNNVSGGKYLGGAKSDATLGRLEGNGQNWMELLVVNNDPSKHTTDLRGYTINWEYNKDQAGVSYGNGTITFSQDPIWAAVPQGTMIAVNEWQKAWYLTNTPPFPGNPEGDPLAAGGLQRDGGIDGLGVPKGNAYNPAVHTLRDFSTNAYWNPSAQGGPDWTMNIWAGERDAQNNFKYFSFSGTVHTSGGGTFQVGIDDDGGLFAANNDDWQFTVKDNLNNIIQGPIGERVPGWAAGGVGSDENLKLESFDAASNPTLTDYQGIGIGAYRDGSSSSYASPNRWTNPDTSIGVQDLSPLRNWFNAIKPGDVNLDGIVDISDVQKVAAGWLSHGGLLSGDANGDGVTDISDIQTIAGNWLSSGGAPGAGTGSAVPEPASAMLCVVGMATCALWQRLRRGRKA